MEAARMRDINYAVSERQATLGEDNQFPLSPTPNGGQSNDVTLDAEDSESNAWVEALLHQSGGDELSLGDVSLDVAGRAVNYVACGVRSSIYPYLACAYAYSVYAKGSSKKVCRAFES